MRPTTALRALLKGDGIVVAPGVYDGLSARLARDAGFAAMYATGGGIARSMGFPDLGLLSMHEVTERVAGIVEHAGVPVIADPDTGYGTRAALAPPNKTCGRARPGFSDLRSRNLDHEPGGGADCT